MKKWLSVALLSLLALSTSLVFADAGVPTIQSAWAQDIDVDTSRSLQILRNVFGGIVYNASGESSPNGISGTVGAMMATYNMGVMTCLWVMMFIIFNIKAIDAGTDGSVLAKRYNTPWIPIRSGFSIIGLMPVFGGWSTAQYLVMTFIVFSTGLADAVSQTGNAYTVANGGPQEFLPNRQKVHNFITNLYAQEVCAQAQTTLYTKRNPDATVSGNWDKVPSSSDVLELAYSYSTKASRKNGKPDFACGGFSMTVGVDPHNDKTNPYNTNFFSGDTIFDGDINAYQNRIRTNAVHAHHEALREVINELPKHIDPDLVNQKEISNQAKYQNTIVTLTKMYERALSSAYQKEAMAFAAELKSASRDSELETLLESGWISHGLMFMNTTRQMAFLSSLSTMVPTIHPARSWNQELVGMMGADATKDQLFISNERARAEVGSKWDLLSIFSNGDPESVLTAAGIWVRDGIRGDNGTVGLGWINTVDYDPLVNAQAMGHRMMIIGGTILGSLSTAKITLGNIKEADEQRERYTSKLSRLGPFGIGSLLAIGTDAVMDLTIGSLKKIGVLMLEMAKYLIPWAAILVLAGAVLAYWLPTIPFLIWMMSIIGWLAQIAEVLLATPIWIAAHAMPEGDGISGDMARTGYLTLISIAVRPSLMVMSLELTRLILRAMGPLLENYWGYFDSMNEGFLALFGSLLSVVFFTILMVLVTHRCLSLIYEITDRTPRYVNAGIETGGEGNHAQGNHAVAAWMNTSSGKADASVGAAGGSGDSSKGPTSGSTTPAPSDDASKDNGNFGPRT